MTPQDYTFKEMVRKLAKNPAEINRSLSDIKCNIMHHALGIATEFLELRQAGTEENFVEEAGDYCFYSEGMLDMFDINLEEQLINGLTKKANSFLDAHELAINLCKKTLIYEDNVAWAGIPAAIIDSLGWLEVELHAKCNTTLQVAIAENKLKLWDRYQNYEYSNIRAKERADKS